MVLFFYFEILFPLAGSNPLITFLGVEIEGLCDEECDSSSKLCSQSNGVIVILFSDHDHFLLVRFEPIIYGTPNFITGTKAHGLLWPLLKL